MTNSKNLWSVLEEILIALKFSDNEIQKVKTDLENLIKAQTTTELLEVLSEEQQRELKSRLENLPEKESEVIIGKYLQEKHSQEKINQQMQKTTKDVLKDYFEDIIQKVNDQQKAVFLQKIDGGSHPRPDNV